MQCISLFANFTPNDEMRRQATVTQCRVSSRFVALDIVENQALDNAVMTVRITNFD